MLEIKFGRDESALVDIPGVFDYCFESEWFADELVRKMVKIVDKSTVIRNRIIDSPFLGDISPRELSGGLKGLILMLKDGYASKYLYYGEQFGDNTLGCMLDVAERVDYDIHVVVNHLFNFPEDRSFEIRIADTGEIVRSDDEYFNAYINSKACKSGDETDEG